jgi:hypothetical protein
MSISLATAADAPIAAADDRIGVSIVIPVFNEVENLPDLVEQVHAAVGDATHAVAAAAAAAVAVAVGGKSTCALTT